MNDRERKRRVAKAVMDGINTATLARELGLYQENVEVKPINALSWRIRIQTPNTGVHYYLVKVSEQI